MKYAYSPLLRAPDRAIDVDMEKPAVVRMMKAMCRARQRNCPRVDETAGVRLERTEYPGLDGEKIPLFVITPAEENAGGTEPGGGEPVGVRDGMRGGCPAMIYLHGGAFALPVQQSALELAAVYAKCAADAGISPQSTVCFPSTAAGQSGKTVLPCGVGWTETRTQKVCAGQRTYAALRGERRGALAAGLTLWRRDQRKGCRQGASGLSGSG